MEMSEQAAYDLVRVALQSDAIKLIGPINKNIATDGAKADAQYLKLLLQELTKKQ